VVVKTTGFHLKDWHNFLWIYESTYLTLLSIVSPLIQKKKHYNAASYNSPRETYSHFKIFGDREKLRGPQVFHYNVSTSTGRNLPETCRAIYKVLKEYYKVRVYNVKKIIIYCYGQSRTLFY